MRKFIRAYTYIYCVSALICVCVCVLFDISICIYVYVCLGMRLQKFVRLLCFYVLGIYICIYIRKYLYLPQNCLHKCTYTYMICIGISM